MKLKCGRLVVSVPRGNKSPPVVSRAVSGWFMTRAEGKIKEKVERYAEQVGKSPKSVGIKSFKSRWGSCSVHGDLTFNWKIIIAPNRIVDYVVVHELCHLIHHDHSPKFWRSVEQVLPDYLESKEWLREFGRTLEV